MKTEQNLAASEESAYYKATRQAVTAASADVPLKKKLTGLARIVARVFDAGAAVLLLDGSGAFLVHTAAWKLPADYVRKGLLTAGKGLAETTAAEPVLFSGARLSGLEFPQQARKAGIKAVLGTPISASARSLGALRVYFKKGFRPTATDLSFLKTIASLAGMAVGRAESPPAACSPAAPAGLPAEERRAVRFAHASEAEFARILDFYGIEWLYEPRSFALDGDEMFTPDFYLPSLDQYIELTTMKQSLVTEKNHKLRLLRQLYPAIRISLMYKKDYDRLLSKYGAGPLSQSRAHGLRRVLFSATDIERRVNEMAGQLSDDYAGKRPVLIGAQRGFLCFMADLMRRVTVPLDLDFMTISDYGQGQDGVRVIKDIELPLTGRHVVLVEDIVDTGITLDYLLRHLQARHPGSLKVCVLLDRKVRRLVDTRLDYVGFEVPDEFVVGYGLDYHEEYRNLPFIAIPEIAGFPAKEAEKAGS
jgi:hypoxanthine phosphoribosyltransferase